MKGLLVNEKVSAEHNDVYIAKSAKKPFRNIYTYDNILHNVQLHMEII